MYEGGREREMKCTYLYSFKQAKNNGIIMYLVSGDLQIGTALYYRQKLNTAIYSKR